MSESTTEAQASESETAFEADLAAMRAADEAPAPAQEAPAAPAEAPAVDDKPRDERVPLATFLEEKKAAKAAREEAERARQEALETQRRFAAVLERLTGPHHPQQPAIPDVEADPVNHFKAVTERQQAELDAIRQQRQAEQARAEFVQRVTTAEAEFVRETPDYLDAVKHLQQTFAAEEDALGLPPGTLAQNVAMAALQNGRNPAQAAYAMAKARGYTGAKPVAPPAEQQLATLERGTQAARGVAGASGGTPPAQLSPAALATMPHDEFEALMAKDRGAFARAFGVR